jgi:hypothetical protein
VTLHHCVNFRKHFKDFIVIQAVKKEVKDFNLIDKVYNLPASNELTFLTIGVQADARAVMCHGKSGRRFC